MNMSDKYNNSVCLNHLITRHCRGINGSDRTEIIQEGYIHRQTDILLTEIKVITDLFVIVIREIYLHVYTIMLVC